MRINQLIFLIFFAACAEFPALDGSVSADASRAAFPVLVPLDPLLAQARMLENAGTALAAQTTAVQSGASDLRARAASLRGPVVDAATRARMRAGVDTSALR